MSEVWKPADSEEFIRGLYAHGAFSQYRSADEAVALLDRPTFLKGIQEFQAYAGMEVSLPNLDRSPKSVTVDEVSEPEIKFFCGQPTIAPFRGQVCKWPAKNPSYTTVGALGNISAPDFKACADLTMGWWSEGCGLLPTYTANSKTANIVMYAKALDGPNGILAQMMLPCGASMNSKMDGQFDLERLVISENPPSGYLDLARIMCHELGHALGTDHLQSGLMAPTYSRNIRKPTLADYAVMISRYGEAVVPVPVPTPVPTPTPGDRIVSFVIGPDGSIKSAVVPGHRVLKV